MNTHRFVIGSAIAGTLAFSTVAVAPAQALTIGSSLGLGGPATLFFEPGTNNIVSDFSSSGQTLEVGFDTPSGSSGTLDFSFLNTSPPPGSITVNRLPLTLISDPASTSRTFSVATLPNYTFIDFGPRTIGSTTAALSFVLDGGNSVGLTNVGGVAFLSDISGRFVFGEEILASGFVSASRSNNAGRYEISATAIPTPALLPGLFGLGVAALRKRKAAAGAETRAVKA